MRSKPTTTIESLKCYTPSNQRLITIKLIYYYFQPKSKKLHEIRVTP